MTVKQKPGVAQKLEGLAKAINASHGTFLKSLRTSLEEARELGALLEKAKEKVVEAGKKWLVWVESNCQFSADEAQRYMRVAKEWPQLQERDDLEDLTL